MSHRRQHVTGHGKGGHEHKTIHQRRADGPVMPVVSRRRHGRDILTDNNQAKAAGFGRFVLLLIAIVLIALQECSGQTHFSFNTSTVVMVDTTGEMTVGSTSWPVRAWSDTLTAGPLKWHGVRWMHVDSGGMFCITPFFRAEYQPGPGGKSLMVMPMGAIRVMEFYEKNKKE